MASTEEELTRALAELEREILSQRVQPGDDRKAIPLLYIRWLTVKRELRRLREGQET